MKFVSKDLAIKLKEKGFNKLCFGYYHLETPTEFVDGALSLNNYSCRGETYKETLERHASYFIPNIIDAPTIEQALEWLREEKDIDIVIYPIDDRNTIFMGGENYILSVYIDRKRDYKVHQDNIDKYVKWEDACIAGIEYVINNLI